MFFATENLVTQALQPSDPWTFKALEEISAQIRGDKEDRQRWYQNPKTRHNFYTAIEGVNATQRVSKDNPPKFLGGYVADYDIKVPAERIAETVKAMEIKPTWFETSLGGNFRLVWVLEKPLPVEDRAFCTFVLQEAHDWLRLGLLPGLDRKAFEETSRLYCNGCNWEATGEPISASKSQAFFVECGRKYRFKAGDDEAVPLDIVEKALHERYQNFSWPGPFELETQGPSFWISGSESTQSAIVKTGGLFTFAAHASKPFYSWTDILGKEFTEKFQSDAIARATEDIWWDSKKYWRKINGVYSGMEGKEFENYLHVTCRLSSKPGQSGISQKAMALEHIYNHQRVVGAVPFVFRRPGLLIYDGSRMLNTYSGEPVQPAGDGPEIWGPSGNFPFMSLWLDGLFVPAEQLIFFLAAYKHFYMAALKFDPRPGQNYFLMGGTGIGKTLVNRHVIGVSVGGFVDASDFLVMGSQFNSHLMKKGLWALDDDSPAGSPQAIIRVQMMFKKIAANQQFLCNTKFENAAMTEWMGRIGCTTNLDFISSRIVGPLDNGSLDKTNLFKCCVHSAIKFPDRAEVGILLTREMPHFLRWLIDWEPPDFVPRDNRYGFQSFHEKSLLEQTYQSSPVASFKEVLIEFLASWFAENKTADKWEGTVSMLLRLITTTNNNDLVLRSLKLEQTSRYLEQIAREGLLKCEVVNGKHQTRVWRFKRF